METKRLPPLLKPEGRYFPTPPGLTPMMYRATLLHYNVKNFVPRYLHQLAMNLNTSHFKHSIHILFCLISFIFYLILLLSLAVMRSVVPLFLNKRRCDDDLYYFV